MSKDLLSRIPLSLATVGSAADVQWVNTDFLFQIAIGGVPFNLALNDVYPDVKQYIRQSTPWKKDQFDSSQSPGEQTFSSWWLRSQLSFHGAEGIRYLEPADDDVVMTQFAASSGVDVWERGQVTLLRDTSNVEDETGPTLVMGYQDGSTDMFVEANGTVVKRHDGTTGTGATATFPCNVRFSRSFHEFMTFSNETYVAFELMMVGLGAGAVRERPACSAP